MKFQIVILISLTIIFFCTHRKEIKSSNAASEFTCEEDSRIIKADLSSGLSTMNDTNELLKKYDTVESIRSEDSITKFIIKNIADLRYDYNKALARDNNLSGKVSIQIRIVSDGSVDSCSIYDTKITDTLFLNSILKRIKKWRFGAIEIPNDTAIVFYPFVFSQ